VEFSYSAVFVENEFQSRIILYIVAKILDKGIRHQLQDFILCMPISNAIGFFSYLIIFNSPNFIQFLVASFFLFGLSIFNRVYVDSGIHFVISTSRKIKEMTINFIIRKTPKSLKNVVISLLRPVPDDEVVADLEKRKISGIYLIAYDIIYVYKYIHMHIYL
jgi:hypothetical protein